MKHNLPRDLKEAEQVFSTTCLQILNNTRTGRFTLDLKFEGLRLMPVVIRLKQYLDSHGLKTKLLWPDAGATALAKKNAPTLANDIFSFKTIINSDNDLHKDYSFLAISPQHYDYEEFNKLCESYTGVIISINQRLEDPAVGIGSVARKRRKEFISSWNSCYWLEPLEKGALMRVYPENWSLFIFEPNGYRLINTFYEKPTSEQINETLLFK